MTPYLIHHLLNRKVDPSCIAVIHGERSITYGELQTACERCAEHLRMSGLSSGERVAILLPKSIEECWAIFAVSQANGIFVPLNPLLRPNQIRHIIEDCGARILITNQVLLNTLDSALRDLSGMLDIILVDDTVEPDAERILGAGHQRLTRSSATIGEDIAAILYTSGSTGSPKGVMLSHRNLLAGCRIVRTYLGITPEERILSILPFSFDYGLNQLLTTMEQGATIVLLSFRFGDEIVWALNRHAITGLAGVPTIWAILARAAPSLPRTLLPRLRYITNSGGAVPTEIVGRLRNLLPTTQIYLMYGLTEAFRSTYLPPEEIDRRSTSIGKAIPETEVFAITPEGRRARPGEPGTLVHRGPTVSRGYWNRPEDTARVLRQHPFVPAVNGGEIVCYSGDLVRMDEDGFFYFIGRDDVMIKSSGYRISPTEVEEALMSTGAFRQAAVIGLPDPITGQRVHAVGVATSPETFVAQLILERVAEDLALYMVPRSIELVEELPISPNGKVDYKTLIRERTGDVAD
jgi:acyl-CoA ligase (AMP-forming) (exosortase A-associated)